MSGIVYFYIGHIRSVIVCAWGEGKTGEIKVGMVIISGVSHNRFVCFVVIVIIRSAKDILNVDWMHLPPASKSSGYFSSSYQTPMNLLCGNKKYYNYWKYEYMNDEL